MTLTEYEAGLPVAVAFPPEEAPSLAGAASRAGWRQFHVAETEKYAHVTYFFNGGGEAAWPGEERLLVPSPQVATYDLQPEMSAVGVTDALVEAIGSGRYDFIVANYANADMVGHTGVWEATVRALETLDGCLARVAEAVDAVDRDDPPLPAGCSSSPPTTATPTRCATRPASRSPPTRSTRCRCSSPGGPSRAGGCDDGVLADVTPTILELAGLPAWPGVAGHSLLEPVLPSDGPSSPRSERP